MEIQKTAYTSSTAKTSKKKKKAEAGFSLSDSEALDSKTTQEVTGTPHISSIESILSLQEVSVDEEQRQKSKAYGNQLLDELDKLRNSLLAGTINLSQLEHIQQRLKNFDCRAIKDPALKEVIAQIELRANVEIAKYKKYKASP